METRTAMLTQPQVRKNQLMPPRKGTPILLSIDRAMAYVYALARPIQLLASGLHFCQAGHLSHRPHEHQHQQGALLLHHQHLPSLQHDRRCLLVLVLDRSQLSQYLSDYSQEMGTMYFRHQPVFPWQSPPYWQCPLRWPAYRWRENSTQN